jgi:hypothetical protein
MTPADLLRDLKRRGVILSIRGDKLHVDAPAGCLTATDRKALAANKHGLMELIANLELRGRPFGGCPYRTHRRFWISVYGKITCAICHPPAQESAVEKWLDVEDETA